MPTATQVPRWLFDNATVDNQVFAVHTQSPRFVARLRYEEEFQEDPPVCLHIDGGWIADPVEWFDRYDRTTFNRDEMEQSLNVSWRRFERDNN
ncbi:hypothetical protein AYO47_06200 [Planctomyces sp. SCGC AG-212-M04]|nr:hypothetical protein AYO47_06200 [Planctomyces sp. SCGC AG-212-M04]